MEKNKKKEKRVFQKIFKFYGAVLWKPIEINVQGEDNVLVLQTEDIVRLVIKMHENDTNMIWLSLENTYFLKVTWV